MEVTKTLNGLLIEQSDKQLSDNVHFKLYNQQFFKEESYNSLRSARILVPFVVSLLKPESVVDFGCGTGAFLRTFKENGINTILGIDGVTLPDNVLMILKDDFKEYDLTKPLCLEKKYDLVISLEVAEHLNQEYARIFISNLVEAGDIILFSAAIPGQGGTHHVNEQWPVYWAKIFEEFGFLAVDCVRPFLWNNPEVDVIYAQNTLLYVNSKKTRLFQELKEYAQGYQLHPLSLVHPSLYSTKIKRPLRNRSGLLYRLFELVNRVILKMQNHPSIP